MLIPAGGCNQGQWQLGGSWDCCERDAGGCGCPKDQEAPLQGEPGLLSILLCAYVWDKFSWYPNLVSPAVINTMVQSNLGEERFIWLTSYSPSLRDTVLASDWFFFQHDIS